MTVVPYEAPARRAWLSIQNPALELANAIAGTDFVPTHFRNNPPAIAAAILYGDEVGIGPMQSLAKIAVINGRPTLAAEAQRALILQAGHDLWVEESTPTRCTVCGRRRGSDAVSRITWTMDDAKRANLSGKTPWKMYPRQMLLARASSDLARAVFPDAIGGLAATEELDEDGSHPVADAAPSTPSPTTRRRRANVTATPPPDPPPVPDLPPLPGEEEVSAQTPPSPTGAPEPGGAPEDTPLALISDAQRTKLQTQFRQVGITDRQERLDYCSAQTGRAIGSANELTFNEASELIDTLSATLSARHDYVSEEQRETIFSLKQLAGVSDARLREILQEVTRQQLVSQIPAEAYEAVVQAIQGESPFV